jgi:hypothetical protein
MTVESCLLSPKSDGSACPGRSREGPEGLGTALLLSSFRTQVASCRSCPTQLCGHFADNFHQIFCHPPSNLLKSLVEPRGIEPLTS